MKVLSVVGARPQFVKAAAVSRILRRRHEETLVHTGQHYDDALSGVFFRELGLPSPEVDLGIGSGSHAAQTGAMLVALERVMLETQPDWVLVYGDTNSTLAGTLAAAKLCLPVAHVEAGLRSHDRGMPEEQNRIVADHLAELLLCPTVTAIGHLEREGLGSRALLVGDVMVDILQLSLPHATWREWLAQELGPERTRRIVVGSYGLLTIHRAANTDDPERLAELLRGIGAIDMLVVFPAHPRVQKAIASAELTLPTNVLLCGPAPYFAMLGLQRDARVVLTDSGGVQKEAYVLAVPCVTLRAETEWPETLEGGWNVLADRAETIAAAAPRPRPGGAPGTPFGDGNAATRVVAALEADARGGRR